MHVKIASLTFAGLLLAAAAPSQAALSFKFSAVTHNEAAKGALNVPADSVKAGSAALGERYLAVFADGGANIFDFDRRARYTMDDKTRTFAAYSLFDTVGFRVIELANRAGIARALGAAKLNQAVLDPVYDENALSVTQGTMRKLDIAQDNGSTTYTVDGKLLARTSGGVDVSAADSALFARFLRYGFGGHPAILARFADQHHVPEKVVFYLRQAAGTQEVTITLSSVATTAPASYDLKGYAPRMAGDDKLEGVLDRAAATPAVPPAQAQKALMAGMNKAFDEHRTFDAMLGALEVNLSTGLPMTPFTPQQKAMLETDPAVTDLLKALAAKDKASMAAAVGTLQQLRQKTMGKQYMLKLFEANDRAMLADPRAAVDLLTGVVRASPGLAGGYKDLGDKLFGSFDMPNAWRSWDIGRRIAPSLNLFEPNNKLERDLAQQHPEYF